MKTSLLAALMCVLLTTIPMRFASAQSCGARVRRNWDSLSTADKTLYTDAIGAAMDSGAYIKFVEVHTEMMSEMEAHRQCMFIYWHRLLLVVFENMLRGQGSRFACVTIPYWDWITAHARFASGQCRSMAECSPIITELGGVPSGSPAGQYLINGIGTQGNCVSAAPLNHFCQSTSARTSGRCMRCVPRGAWGSLTFPGSASLASIRSQIFSARNIAEMSTAIENGAHNAIHAALDGAMGTFASNSDPIFYSHHAMVDLLHVTFHHCRVGDATLTLQQKASNAIGWSSCQRRGGGVFNPLDTVLMRTGENGANTVYIGQDAVIGRYFQNVPNQYAALMDVRDLGASSYSYETSGVLGNMYTSCDGNGPASGNTNNNVAPTPAAPVAAPQLVPQIGISLPSINVGFGSITQGISNILGRVFGRGTARRARTLRSESGHSLNSAAQSNPSSSTSHSTSAEVSSAAPTSATQSSSTSTSTTSSSTTTSFVSVVSTTTNVFVQKTESWCDDTKKQVQAALRANSSSASTAATETASLAEVEKMMCMFQHECLGGVHDYSAAFKQSFMVSTKPRCKFIVDAIAAGTDTIQLPNWKASMVQKFGCPFPSSSRR